LGDDFDRLSCVVRLAPSVLLNLNQSFANGGTIAGAVAFYFSFFTILTNLLVALGTTFAVSGARCRIGLLFSQPVVQTATAIYISVVGVVYSFILRELWAPTGLQKIADVLLHDLIPLLYVAFWIFFVPKSNLRWCTRSGGSFIRLSTLSTR
jgi:hypothetical protein